MNIYLLTQFDSTGYDTFDSMIVIAKSPQQAILIHPEASWYDEDILSHDRWSDKLGQSWADSPSTVAVEFIGKAKVKGPRIVCTSFNAG